MENPSRRPPFVATWLVSHWGNQYQREALVGDLMEEYHRGRTDAWYWMQVGLALCASAGMGLRRKAPLLRVLVWWSVLLAVGIENASVVPLCIALDPSLYCLVLGVRRSRVKSA